MVAAIRGYDRGMSNLLVNETFNDWRDRWATEVGRFVLAMGSIESFTYRALRALLGPEVSESVKDLPLNKRLEILIAVCGTRNEPKWAEIAKLLKQAQALLRHRNIVAHNTLGVLIEFDDQENVISEIEAILAERGKDKHILFDRMVGHRKEAEQIDQDLHEKMQTKKEQALQHQ